MRQAAIASVVVGLLVTTLPSAQAAFPGSPGLLVFSSDGNIYSVAPDGTPPLSQLTFDGNSEHPRWSPDGTRIAFDRNGDIFVMGANGQNVRRLTTLGGSSQPAWAPGGNRLVFVRQPTVDDGGDLWIVSLSGGTPTRLTFQGANSCVIAAPTWSPRGGRIAYEWERRTPDTGCAAKKVVILRLDPRERTVIPFASHPDFTADGRGVFFGSAWDPEGDFFWPGENLSWSGLYGGRRQRLTSLFCAEGDPCFVSGAGSPRSAFPGGMRYVFVFSRLGGAICVRTDAGDGFCSDDVPVRPQAVDWQPV